MAFDFNPDNCVHIAIDWQKRWHDAMADAVWPMETRAADFTKQLRAHGVPTLWVIWPDEDEPEEGLSVPMSVQECSERFDERDIPLLAKEGDAVLPKYGRSAFLGTNLVSYLREELGRRTLLISGGFRDQCVHETIETGLRYDDLSFVVVSDLIVPRLIAYNKELRRLERIVPFERGDIEGLFADNKDFYQNKRSSGDYPAGQVTSKTGTEILKRLSAANANRPQGRSVVVPPAGFCLA